MNEEEARRLHTKLKVVMNQHGIANGQGGIMHGLGSPKKRLDDQWYVSVHLDNSNGKNIPDNLRTALKQAYQEATGRAYNALEQRESGKTDIRVEWDEPAVRFSRA